jgi:7-cyano-7-deazaguanine synthase
MTLDVSSRGDEYLCRNALLILSAAAEFGGKPLRIALGAHAQAHYYDCSSLFFDEMRRLLDGYFQGQVSLETPLLTFNKADIVAYARRFHVPVSMTYSCTRAALKPCGECPSCLDRKALGI